MKRHLLIFSSALACVMLLAVCQLHAAQPVTRSTSGGENEINVIADKLSTADGANRIEASGNVELKRQEMRLKADEVRFNRATQDVEAKGRIVVEDPEWKVKSADALRMNMGTEAGVIENGDIFLENGHVSVTGRRFEKFGGQTYHIDDGFFTTCLCDSGAPSWKFYAEQMDLTLDGTGTIKNGFFHCAAKGKLGCFSRALATRPKKGFVSFSHFFGRFRRAATRLSRPTLKATPGSVA
jgi:lipopolysaccharide assembly outer membrane protein LptD (OstA)